MRPARIILLLVSMNVVAACAQAPATPEPLAQAIEQTKQAHEAGGCFYIHNVDSRRVLDKRHVLVYAPSLAKPWLVELSNACPLLDDNDVIVLEGTAGQMCGKAGEALKSREQVCGVAAIYAITPDEASVLLDARKKR